jgi:hypothetical protein
MHVQVLTNATCQCPQGSGQAGGGPRVPLCSGPGARVSNVVLVALSSEHISVVPMGRGWKHCADCADVCGYACAHSTILWMHNPSLMHSRSEIFDGEVRLPACILPFFSS